MKNVGRSWRGWHRIDGGGVNSLRALCIPQELIEKKMKKRKKKKKRFFF